MQEEKNKVSEAKKEKIDVLIGIGLIIDTLQNSAGDTS